MPDIDIDFADRQKILDVIPHTRATIWDDKGIKPHNTGVYFVNIPTIPGTDQSAFDHKVADQLGYFKLDLLNVSVYEHVRNELHLVELMCDPNWLMLFDKTFFERVIHIGNHWDLMCKMPEPIDSIPRMAMFLAIIRPGKRYLVGKPWAEVAQSVWQRPEGDEYFFKKSHSVAYAQLVAVHMNILEESE